MKGTNGNKPQTNGTDPVENGVNGTEDIDMVDEEDQVKPSKDGDDEMTVVVPPPKSSKLSGHNEQDPEGDIAMDSAEKTDTEGIVPELVDPKIRAASGWFLMNVEIKFKDRDG